MNNDENYKLSDEFLAQNMQKMIRSSYDEIEEFLMNKPALSTAIALMQWLKALERSDPKMYDLAEEIFLAIDARFLH